jgi:hypothetical protein
MEDAMSNEITFCDGLLPGGRRPRLYFTDGLTAAVKFAGATIPGIAVVLAAQYKKDGKWSKTTSRIALADGVRALRLCSALHSQFGDEFGSWAELAGALQLPRNIAEQVVRAEYGATAARLDAAEAALLALSPSGGLAAAFATASEAEAA